MNFLVLQKDYKILVHNLSMYEKVEQSTLWIIQKKWGKDFTFGSDCTVWQSLQNISIIIIKVVRSRLSSQFTFGSDCTVAYIQIATVRLSYTSEAAAIVFNTFCSITHQEIHGEQGIETAPKFIQDELVLALASLATI